MEHPIPISVAISNIVSKTLRNLIPQIDTSQDCNAVLEVIPLTEKDQILLKMWGTGTTAETIVNITIKQIEYVSNCCMRELCPFKQEKPKDERAYTAMKFII